MAVDLRPYGRLPVLAVWCFFGTCFYSFVAYQMFGERGKRNRVSFLVIFFFQSGKFTRRVLVFSRAKCASR